MPHNNAQDQQHAANPADHGHDAGGRWGALYGIGVGPGDPELLTLRAVKSLGKVDVILAASSSKNDYSIAHEIASRHLPAGIETLRLPFPMTLDADELQKAWEANAAATAKVLWQGRNAAFLTLGDPLIFSTFGYLLRELLKLMPELDVRIEPGITSFQEAAAASRTMLCSAGENFLLVSGVNSGERLTHDLNVADNAAILKAYRNFPVIAEAVKKSRHGVLQSPASAVSRAAQSRSGKLSKDAEPVATSQVFVSRLGFADQRICHNLADIKETPPYLSLLLLGKRF